ncbi:MAG: hypothetical protein WC188_03955 [Candidatus Caldatribacteriota bacterium]|nr:hypothetical protein [Patescibacteria group bacterium]
MKYYIKYAIKYSLIYDILQKLNKKKINFFIDLQSIAKGFYNKDVVLVELGRYATENKVSDILIDELKNFLNDLFVHFKKYDPFFTIFYDDGFCQQQKAIDGAYKAGRSFQNIIVDNHDIELFRQIKKYYYLKIEKQFTIKDLSQVYYLREYEADFIPHYCIRSGLYDSDDIDVLNIILSVDKDLLQTCQFKNTIQCITSFKQNLNKRGFQIQFDAYDDDNAISYINKKFKRGILTSKYIPMILAIGGDKADEIPGIPKIGPTRAIDLIINHNIPITINELKAKLNLMPDIIKSNFELISKNYKMISFDEQLKRVSKNIMHRSFILSQPEAK